MFDRLYRQYRIDHLRCRLIWIRDDLFNAADEGQIDFNTAAYCMTRQILSGMITFAHDFSFWRFLIMSSTQHFWSSPETTQAFSERYSRAVGELEPGTRAIVTRSITKAHLLIVVHVLHASMITFPIVLLARLVAVTVGRVQRAMNCLESKLPEAAFRMVDRGAYVIGSQSKKHIQV